MAPQDLCVDSGTQHSHCQGLVAKTQKHVQKPCLHVPLAVVPKAATFPNYGKKGTGEFAEVHEFQASSFSSPFLCSCPLPKGETLVSFAKNVHMP